MTQQSQGIPALWLMPSTNEKFLPPRWFGFLLAQAPASTANNFTFNHNLSTTNVIVQAYKSNKMVMCEVEIVDANNVKLVFAQNQNANDITVNVLSAAS